MLSLHSEPIGHKFCTQAKANRVYRMANSWRYVRCHIDTQFAQCVFSIMQCSHRHNRIPDYTIRVNEAGELVTFTPQAAKTALPQASLFPMISENALQKARNVAPRYDVYALKADYLTFWDQKGRQELKNADAAFLGWRKKRNERNPLR